MKHKGGYIPVRREPITLPDSYFIRVKKDLNGYVEAQLRKKVWFWSYLVDHARLVEPNDGEVLHSLEFLVRKEANLLARFDSRKKLLGDYLLKKF